MDPHELGKIPVGLDIMNQRSKTNRIQTASVTSPGEDIQNILRVDDVEPDERAQPEGKGRKSPNRDKHNLSKSGKKPHSMRHSPSGSTPN